MTLLAGAIMLVFYGIAIRTILRSPGIVRPSYLIGYVKGKWIVFGANPNDPAAAKLRRGDRLVSFDGDRRAARIGIAPFMIFVAPGGTYRLGLQRDGTEYEQHFTLPSPPPTNNPAYIFSFGAVSAACLGMAMLMGLIRPENPLARLGCIAGLLMALRMFGIAMSPYSAVTQGFERALYSMNPLNEMINLAVGFHFFYRLSGVRSTRIWPAITVMLYVVCISIFLGDAAAAIFLMQGRERAVALFNEYPVSFLRDTIYAAANFYMWVPLGICAVVLHGYLQNRDRDHRRRLRWVVIGVVGALMPIALNNFLAKLGFRVMHGVELQRTLILIPITLAYAVVRHQVLGLEVVIRQGLQYLLARNVLYIALLLPLAGLAMPFALNPDRSIAAIVHENPVYLNLGLAAAASLGLKYRQSMQTWVDRKFFREVYDGEQILHGLIEAVRQENSLAEISRIVSDQVNAALHPRCIHVFYRQKESSEMTLGYSSAGSGTREIPAGSELLRLLENSKAGMDAPFTPLPAAERQWLEALETRLVIPIAGSRPQVAGLLLLGEKRSEEPYSPGDRRLLRALAGEMAQVAEKMWLQARVDEESRMRIDVLSRLDKSEIDLLRECPQCGRCFDRTIRTCPADGSPVTLTLPVEYVIEGKYRLERRLGQGGMGVVFEAADIRLKRNVAIKILMGNLFGNRTALRRFEREAQATARLAHPNIVNIYDFGSLGVDGAYLVMELLQGATWRARLEQRGAIPSQLASRWFQQLLAGLAAAHENGIVHRDLKPENVMVMDDQIKIMDFGLAKVHEPDSGSAYTLTRAGTVLGTVGYMAPEQLMGRASDHRSDIFAVGVMLAEALSGQRPFAGANPAEVLTSMLNEEFVVPGTLLANTSLCAVLRRCLAKNPDERFQSVQQLGAEVEVALALCATFEAGKSSPSQITTRGIGA